MRNLVIWNVEVAAVLGGIYRALAHLLVGMKRADAEHACWAVRTMHHDLPQIPDEARRDLTRALFIS